jgi:hypothetical protein
VFVTTALSKPSTVRLTLARSTLRAGQEVSVTIVNGDSLPILRDICLSLQRRVGSRWQTITRTHGVPVACPRVGFPQGGHSSETLGLPLYDDLVPGAYRATILYKPMTLGVDVELNQPDDDMAHVSFTVLAFRTGAKAHLSNARIRKIAERAATQNGDPKPTLIQHSEGTRFAANLVASGDLVFGWAWSYLIAVRGHFVLNGASVPPGAPAPHGTVITLVVNASTGQVTDSGVSDRYPDLAKLGPVVSDLH